MLDEIHLLLISTDTESLLRGGYSMSQPPLAYELKDFRKILRIFPMKYFQMVDHNSVILETSKCLTISIRITGMARANMF